ARWQPARHRTDVSAVHNDLGHDDGLEHDSYFERQRVGRGRQRRNGDGHFGHRGELERNADSDRHRDANLDYSGVQRDVEWEHDERHLSDHRSGHRHGFGVWIAHGQSLVDDYLHRYCRQRDQFGDGDGDADGYGAATTDCSDDRRADYDLGRRVRHAVVDDDQ